MSAYETVIGLEVHVQLASRTKIFCSCPAGWGGDPNTRVCPVCLGLPGVLPVFNEKVLELAVAAALSLGCAVAGFSTFDRKNYYYPDLPKNFQISQFDRPIATGGGLEIAAGEVVKRIGITRAHLEEDAGKLTHCAEQGYSGVDYNRTGVPLLEIVSDPELRSPQEACDYLKALKAVLRYAGVSECDMEKGSFRCDANISIRPAGEATLGVKVEIKNMNSFRSVERALAYEAQRQRKAVGRGERIVQETRLFDAESQQTFSMRSKEEAHDYRYFPEPDLVPLVLEREWVESIRRGLPESPSVRRARFQKDYGLSEYDAGVLTAEKSLSEYYEAAARGRPNHKAVANWIMAELLGKLHAAGLEIDASPVSAVRLAALVGLIEDGAISGKMAKEVFAEMFSTGRDPAEIVKERGMAQISDAGELEAIVDRAIFAHPGPVAEFKAGKGKALAFLVGQVMKATAGKANPQIVNQILRRKLV
jgi:aspartyl-tRNA(Asn)/glutamyl-tRNA(Gln) amidotransferase subunit B